MKIYKMELWSSTEVNEKLRVRMYSFFELAFDRCTFQFVDESYPPNDNIEFLNMVAALAKVP